MIHSVLTDLDPRRLSENQRQRLGTLFKEKGKLTMEGETGKCGRCQIATRYYTPTTSVMLSTWGAEDKWFNRDGLIHWYTDHNLSYYMMTLKWQQKIQQDYETLQRLLKAKI